MSEMLIRLRFWLACLVVGRLTFAANLRIENGRITLQPGERCYLRGVSVVGADVAYTRLSDRPHAS